MFYLKKKSKILISVVVLALLLHVTFAFGQGSEIDIPDMINYKNILPASPNAASLGKYGEIPVSMYTGVPNISIPLWELKAGSYSLPISLSYHASGIKVSEIASWVGTGWSLNAGGVITRSVNGRPDEVRNDGYWTNSSQIPTPEEYTDWEPQSMLRVSRGLEDYEPDVYYFNFAGYSGKFFISVINNGMRNFIFNAYTANYKNMRISINLDAHLDEIESIIITTEDGIKYTFGTGTEFIERLVPLGNPCTDYDIDNTYITAWYLKSIELPVGNKTIDFSYQKVNDKEVQTSTESRTTSINPTYGVGGCSGNCPGGSSSSCSRIIKYDQLLLSTISSPEYEITFQRNTTVLNMDNGYELQSVEIKSLLNDSTRLINFDYTHHNRLFLSKVWVNNQEPYVFNYYGFGLPDYQSFAVDYWGFYNGKPNNTYVPNMIFNGMELGGADRKPVLEKTKYGTLSKITYPTKGYTEFEFEAHDYPTQSTDNVLNYIDRNAEVGVDVELGEGPGPFVDGTIIQIDFGQYVEYRLFAGTDFEEPVDGYVSFTRIGAPNPIKELFPNGNGIEDTYKTGVILLPKGKYYVKAYMQNSGGFIRCEINYKELEGGTEIGEWRNEIVGGLRIKEIRNYDFDGKLTAQKEFRYRQFEKPELSSGKLVNGRLIFQYVNTQYMGMPPISCIPAPTPEVLDMSFTCSYIVRTSSASNNMRSASGSHIVYTEVTEYNGGFISTNPDIAPDIGEGANGKIENTFTFWQDGKINDALPYAPATNKDWMRGLPLQSTYFDKNGDTVRIEKSDYQFTDIKKIPGFKVALVAEHYTDFPNEYASRYYYYLSGNQSNVSKTIIEFKDNERMLENSTNYSYVLGSSRLSSQISYLPDGTTLTKQFKYPDFFPGYNVDWINQLQGKYMLNQLISQEIQKTSPGLSFHGLIASKIVSYKDKMPEKVFAIKATEAASHVNITPTYINQATYESDDNFYNAVTVKNDIDAANIIEYKTANDVPVSIIWGYNKNFPVAKVEGASYIDLGHLSGFDLNAIENTAYFSDEDLRNRLAPLRTLPNAMVTINTYDPLSGITSSTDPNGKRTFYEYDGFGRLVLVRDDENNILKKHVYVTGGLMAAKPTGLSVISTEYNQIQLDWDDAEGSEKYNIYFSTDGINFDLLTSVTASAYLHTGLNPFTTYYFKVTSVFNYLESGAANVTATTKMAPPGVPVFSSAVALSNSEIELKWDDVSNEENYILSITPLGTAPTDSIILGANATSYKVTNLLADQVYVCIIKATNQFYNSMSDLKKCKTKKNPPTIPIGLTTSPISNTSIQINWANVSYEEGYQVYRSSSVTGTYSLIGTVGANITSYTNTSLLGNTTYYYKVKAYNSDYESALSAYISCKTKLNPPGAPSLTLSCSSASLINLSWNDVANETSYKIYRGATAATIALIASLPAGTTSYSNSGLVAGNIYYYKLEAYNIDYANSSTIEYSRTIPPQPGVITGESKPCLNTVQTYSVAPVNGAYTYEWVPPSGWTITSGQGSRIITLEIGAGFKNTLKVRASNLSGNSDYKATVILPITSLPIAAGPISGDSNVIPTDIETYSISNVIGADNYTWTVPKGCRIISGQGTTSLTVEWGLFSGNIIVRPRNCVGESTTSTQKYVTVQGGGGKF